MCGGTQAQTAEPIHTLNYSATLASTTQSAKVIYFSRQWGHIFRTQLHSSPYPLTKKVNDTFSPKPFRNGNAS